MGSPIVVNYVIEIESGQSVWIPSEIANTICPLGLVELLWLEFWIWEEHWYNIRVIWYVSEGDL